MSAIQSLCVFCGSKTGTNPVFHETARELGDALARQHLRLIYGGGNIGLMGVVADAVLAAGGEVTGVIPNALVARELVHVGVQDMRIVESMHDRKALMAELADGFVALPGGLGTFEELFEILTWAQLDFHNKPVAVLNVKGYFSPLVELIDHAVAEGFVRPQHRELLHVAADVEELIQILRQIPVDTSSHSQELRRLT
jgi:uncharacterized protein (TIGR00730 family)